MVTRRTEELLKADLEYVIHPAGVVGDPDLGRIMEKAYGVYVVDTEGKKYIDLSSQLMCSNLGHGQKKIQDAIKEAISQTDYTTCYWGLNNTYNIECAKRLAEITPGDLNHAYFTSGGGESVDAAIKIARLYWHYQGKSEKNKIITLYNAYHGTTGMAVSATTWQQSVFQTGVGPITPNYVHIAPPYCYRCFYGLTYPDCNLACARYLENVIRNEGPSSVAAFMAEGIQGAGGIIDAPPEWWSIIKKVCDDYGVLVIDDEVMSGFARTGKMFAIEHYNVIPDIMIMAKGISGAYLPFGAVSISNKVHDSFKDKFFAHGTTYAGHPITSAAALAALALYKELNVVENAARVGSHIRQRLDTEFLLLPCIGNVGGKGVFQAVELVSDKKTKALPTQAAMDKLRVDLWDKGIVLREAGMLSNRLIIAPPCTITIEEINKALDIVYAILAQWKPK